MPTETPLIQVTLEVNEDIYLSEITNERIKNDNKKRISHDTAWE